MKSKDHSNLSKVFKLIELEGIRQKTGLEMIPSENYVSKEVLEAYGSILTNKYSEGFPGARYYGGNEVIDQIERYCQDLANKLFKTKHAIVQPYSGSPANFAVYLGLLEAGDTVCGQALPMGGHLTHGAPASFTGKLFNAVQYGVGSDGRFNYKEIEKVIVKAKPKLIWVGATAYPYIIDFKKFSDIAKKVGAYLAADIAHIAGLIVGGMHPSPVPYVDIVTTTTHKTLRGPRGAMILITAKGLKKDPDLAKKLEKAVFPGTQGGPHNHQTAAIAVSLEEALTPAFKKYASQIVKNSKALAQSLKDEGVKLVGSGSENHLMLIDLTYLGRGTGYQAQHALEVANITVNKNTIPNEPFSPFYPSGIRLGTPALTSRGMKEGEMIKIGKWIAKILQEIKGLDTPEEKDKRPAFIKEVKQKLSENKNLLKIKKEVANFASKYPVPGLDS
ncbi:serine hydroxymethyltransferase [Candidatus Daviesbacteria bacterium]|nr:serine hydroxymethyltransferase [Candidatus Daviesbacteria bacterium]